MQRLLTALGTQLLVMVTLVSTAAAAPPTLHTDGSRPVSTRSTTHMGSNRPTRFASPADRERFGVGLTTFDAEDPSRPGRVLTFDVWYPTNRRTTTGEPASLNVLGTEVDMPGVRRDARPAMKRPSPLVVFSHGSTTTRFEAWFLMESLAGHGYVVIAPDHAGNTLPDLLSGRAQPSQTIARERPLDVSFAIDQAIARSADPTDLLARTVDGSRVAVVGRSFGGFTALATASGFRDVPPDDRVDAIVPIAASSQWLSDQELAAVKVPILLLSGTKDETVPLSTAAERPWSITASRPAWRVDLEGAGHNSFTNICDMLDPLRNAGLPSVVIDGLAEEGCSPDLIPVDDAHRLTEHFVLAFLRTTLDHHPWSQRLLSPQFARRHHLPVEVEVRTGRACYGHDWRLD